MHPKATTAIADGKTNDADDAVNECILLVNTIADFGLMAKPLVFRDFLYVCVCMWQKRKKDKNPLNFYCVEI